MRKKKGPEAEGPREGTKLDRLRRELINAREDVSDGALDATINHVRDIERRVVTGHVLHGEILPPKRKRLGAVARHATGKAISTERQAQSAGPGSHPVAGVAGLTLEVGKSGSGSYVWRYRFGRRRFMGLGSRKRVTLAEAIDAANLAKISAQLRAASIWCVENWPDVQPMLRRA